MPEPYRDESESLRAEVARLQRELSRRRAANARLGFFLALLEVGAIVALRPWLNGSSDVQFWAAAAILVAIAVAALASAWGFWKG